MDKSADSSALKIISPARMSATMRETFDLSVFLIFPPVIALRHMHLTEEDQRRQLISQCGPVLRLHAAPQSRHSPCSGIF